MGLKYWRHTANTETMLFLSDRLLQIVAHRRGPRTALGTHSEHSLSIYYEMVFLSPACPCLAWCKSELAQRKRAGPITPRSMVRSHDSLTQTIQFLYDKDFEYLHGPRLALLFFSAGMP